MVPLNLAQNCYTSLEMARRENCHEEEVLEDVSLCDLPLLNSPTKEAEINNNKKKKQPNDGVSEPQEEFAFGSVTGGSLSAGLEMCAADEVFFRGQILPLRPSVSFDAAIPSRPNMVLNPTRSESMDRASLVGFRSGSSRSSSSSGRSTAHQEAAAAMSAPMTISLVTSEPRLRTRNQFHTHPSPKLHIRASSARSSASGPTGARLDGVHSGKVKHKSSLWELFRLGLVRTPDIDMQELRANLRSNSCAANRSASSNNAPVSRSSSSGNNSDSYNTTNTASSISSANITAASENPANVDKQKRRNFLSGCKCSAEAVASNAIVVKSKGNDNNTNGSAKLNGTKLAKALLEENHRLIKMKNKKNIKSNIIVKQSGSGNYDDRDHQKPKKHYLKDQGRRKQAHVSHHRTYEWLKELSHANLPMHV